MLIYTAIYRIQFFWFNIAILTDLLTTKTQIRQLQIRVCRFEQNFKVIIQDFIRIVTRVLKCLSESHLHSWSTMQISSTPNSNRFYSIIANIWIAQIVGQLDGLLQGILQIE